MSLKKRAIEGVVVAGSLVMIGTIAETADKAAVQPVTAVAEAANHTSTGQTAGVIAQLGLTEAFAGTGDLPVDIERTGMNMVTTAGSPAEEQMIFLTVDVTTGQSGEARTDTDMASGNMMLLQAGAVAEMQPDVRIRQAGAEAPEETLLQAGAVAELQPGGTAAEEQAGAVAELQPGGTAAEEQAGDAQPGGTAAEEQAGDAQQSGTAAEEQAGDAQQSGAAAEEQPGTGIPQETQPQTGEAAEAQPDVDEDQNTALQPQAGAVAEVQPGAGISAELSAGAGEEQLPQEDVTADASQNPTQEETEWQNRLMPDVQEFLYVREAGDEEASIVGKLYKGAVAEVVEHGETWTHVVSGNVDGYVMNSYCLFGTDAMNYATENFDTKAEIMTNGLRVRRSADTESAVMAAVSTGTYLLVDTDAEVVDGWVAVTYGGETGYVSAEYVTTELDLGEGITVEEEKAAAAKAAEQAAAAKAEQVSSPGTVQNAAVAASVDDVTLLAALIQCEAGNEPYEGQLAVGAVVMNRVRSGAYPGSVYGVIYQSGQFTPAGRGSVAAVAANGPKASCIQAAQEALNGMDNTGGAIRFQRASGGHAGVVIGNHVFF